MQGLGRDNQNKYLYFKKVTWTQNDGQIHRLASREWGLDGTPGVLGGSSSSPLPPPAVRAAWAPMAFSIRLRFRGARCLGGPEVSENSLQYRDVLTCLPSLLSQVVDPVH